MFLIEKAGVQLASSCCDPTDLQFALWAARIPAGEKEGASVIIYPSSHSFSPVQEQLWAEWQTGDEPANH